MTPRPRQPALSLFLITYQYQPAQVGSVPFHDAAWLRPIYFGPLVPHLVLAALVVPLAPTTSTGRGIDPLDALAQPVVVADGVEVAAVCLGSALRYETVRNRRLPEGRA